MVSFIHTSAINHIIQGSYQNKLQYAASEFGWSTETVGAFTVCTSNSISSILSTDWLLAESHWGHQSTRHGSDSAWYDSVFSWSSHNVYGFLLVTIKFLKQKILNRTSPTDLNSSELTPLLEDDPQPGSPIRGAKFMNKIDSAWFDLCLAKFSLVVDIMTSLGMAVARTGRQFTVAGVFGAFGLGFNPAMQSVTLALYAGRGGTEAGRLFGALSVIQAFGCALCLCILSL
jgi:hypothetical protein